MCLVYEIPGLRKEEDLEASSHSMKCESLRDLCDGPVVQILSFHHKGYCWIPGWGVKILHAPWYGQKIIKNLK